MGEGYRSVAVKLSMVAVNDEDALSPRARPSVAELDTHRQSRQLVQLQEEEREAALWIHGVTGDPGIEEAVAGERSLQAALHRGEAGHFRQLANICLFLR